MENIDTVVGMEFLGETFPQKTEESKEIKPIGLYYSSVDKDLYHKIGEQYIRADKVYQPMGYKIAGGQQ